MNASTKINKRENVRKKHRNVCRQSVKGMYEIDKTCTDNHQEIADKEVNCWR